MESALAGCQTLLGRPPMKLVRVSLLAALALGGCRVSDNSNSAEETNTAQATIAPILTTPDARDTHSYARPQEARVTHVALDLTVDFEAKRIGGTATLDIDRKAGA